MELTDLSEREQPENSGEEFEQISEPLPVVAALVQHEDVYQAHNTSSQLLVLSELEQAVQIGMHLKMLYYDYDYAIVVVGVVLLLLLVASISVRAVVGVQQAGEKEILPLE